MEGKKETVRVYAPATVANLACGFDVLGLALSEPGDIVEIRKNNTATLTIIDNSGTNLPTVVEKNVASVAAQALLDELGSKQGFDIVFEKKINPGSGIGSSAASCAAAVFGINELLGRPLTRKQLVRYAMKGESLASNAEHADNIAPAILGGITLVRGYKPLDIVEVPVKEELYITIIHPDTVINTKEGRDILPKEIPLTLAVKQWGNLAGLIAGFYSGDKNLIKNSLHDHIIEPVRAKLIPEFNTIKTFALKKGALGCSISGSGPAIFALCDDKKIATTIAKEGKEILAKVAVESDIYVSKINTEGVQVL